MSLLHASIRRPHSSFQRPMLSRIALGSRLVIAGFMAIAILLAIAPAADAKTFFCDGGDVSCLIAGIQAANADVRPDTIVLASGTYSVTMPVADLTFGFGPKALPSITSALTIRGAGADDTVIERSASASSSFRLFTIEAAGNLTLEGVTLRNGGELPASTAARSWPSVH